MRDLFLKLFNLDGADFEGAETWTLRFTADWAPPVIVFGSLALIVLVWQIYKRERGTAAPAFKTMLALFRLAALAALVFILLAPAVVVATSELKEAYVIILADKSDSMDLADRYRDEELAARLAYATGLSEELNPSEPLDPDIAQKLRAMSRADIANRVLANPQFDLVGRIANHSKVRQFVFASTISSAPTPEPSDDMKRVFGRLALPAPAGTVRPLFITPGGPTTQIGESLRDAVAELRGQRIAAVVILSDWCSNSGISPVEALRLASDAPSSFPIIAVGVGDPAEQRDIVVSSVSANAVAFLNDPLVFNVAIEQSGYDGLKVPLQLRIGENIVATKEITLAAGRKYHTISHKPPKKGIFKYTVSVPVRIDELSDKNNSTDHTVTVKDDKIRVLLIAGGPTWEWRHWKPALMRDRSIELSAWLQSADQGWAMAGGKQVTQLPLNKKELVDSYDVIVMLGASSEAFSEEQLDNIRSFVGDFGGGLIFCAGTLTPPERYAETPLAKCLPVVLGPTMPRPAATASFKLNITPEGWAHPATKLADDEHENRQIWQNLPGLFWFYPVEKVKPGAHVLATHPEEKNQAGQPVPIFVEQRYGAGKVFFSGVDSTWRWRFLIDDRQFYRFWRQTLALTGANKLLGTSKRLTVSVARSKYTIGQRVEIEVKLLDEMFRPTTESAVRATIDLPGGSTRQIKLTLADPTQGAYRGSFIPRKIGNYAVWMRSSADDKPETAPFSVAMSTLESESRRLNIELMKEVAAKTSGAWFTIDRIAEVPDRIKSESQNIITERPISIWDSWGCLLLFVIPLTFEWALRKRRLLT